jgi:hypothetical protein
MRSSWVSLRKIRAVVRFVQAMFVLTQMLRAQVLCLPLVEPTHEMPVHKMSTSSSPLQEISSRED